MMKFIKFFLVTFFLIFVGNSSKADTHMTPGLEGLIDETYNDCGFGYFGGTVTSGGSTCDVYFYINAYDHDGDRIATITFYYYDNSGSQYFYAGVMQNENDSLSGASLVTTSSEVTDTSTSSSIQSKTLSIYSLTTSDYSYMIYVRLNYGTSLRGFKVGY